MSHGFARVFTDHQDISGVHSPVMGSPLTRPQFRRLLFDNERKKIRENPCESVAKVLA
jgi:hypothetical protein